MDRVTVQVEHGTDAERAAASIWAAATARRDATPPRSADETLPGIRARLAADGSALLIARTERRHEPVGFSVVATRPSTLEVFYLAVDPVHWGGGVARLLLGHVDRRARAVDRDALELWVIDGNDRALAAYLAAGWTSTVDRQQVGPSVVERRLVRRLPPGPV